MPINDALFGLVIYNDPWTRIPFDPGFQKDLCLQHVFLGCFKLGSFLCQFMRESLRISYEICWMVFLLFDIHAVAAFWTDSRRGWNTGMCVSGDVVPILLRSPSILIYYVLKLKESNGDYWNLPLYNVWKWLITPPSTSGSEATWFTTPLLIVSRSRGISILPRPWWFRWNGPTRGKPRVSQQKSCFIVEWQLF